MDFASAAARFCSVVEEAGSSRHWLFDLRGALNAVFAAASRLPEVDPVVVSTASGMSLDEWSSLFEELRARLAGLVDPDVDVGVLTDDLVDIYRALRDGLERQTSGVAPEDVLFGWREQFDSQWSAHALSALGLLGKSGNE